jgi:mannose-6-phosphate isomerase-like protein (cupin superfamily)
VRPPREVIDVEELPRTAHAHELVGADHGDVPFSLIVVKAGPGIGPGRHRHPYAEVFVVEAGEATFEVGDETFAAHAGQIVVGPPGVPHGFVNGGTGELRLLAIHGAARFDTEWLSGRDEDWASRDR